MQLLLHDTRELAVAVAAAVAASSPLALVPTRVHPPPQNGRIPDLPRPDTTLLRLVQQHRNRQPAS